MAAIWGVATIRLITYTILNSRIEPTVVVSKASSKCKHSATIFTIICNLVTVREHRDRWAFNLVHICRDYVNHALNQLVAKNFLGA